MIQNISDWTHANLRVAVSRGSQSHSRIRPPRTLQPNEKNYLSVYHTHSSSHLTRHASQRLASLDGFGGDRTGPNYRLVKPRLRSTGRRQTENDAEAKSPISIVASLQALFRCSGVRRPSEVARQRTVATRKNGNAISEFVNAWPFSSQSGTKPRNRLAATMLTLWFNGQTSEIR